MPAGLNAQGSGIPISDAMGSFKRRKRKSIIVTVMLLIVSILILVFGLAATTRTQNITVGGYYPGVILGFGSFLGIIGAHLIENKRQMLVASIVFISFGVVAAFCCAIVDGVFAARHIDLRPLYAGRCEYYSSGTAFDLDVHCNTASRVSCPLRVKSNTCYCCDLYNCGKEHPLMGLQTFHLYVSYFFYELLAITHFSPRRLSRVELRGGYHEYTEVRSCQDVVHLYHLLWSATILNIVALFLGIITAAVLGGFKDMYVLPEGLWFGHISFGKLQSCFFMPLCQQWCPPGSPTIASLFIQMVTDSMPTAAPDSCEPEPLPIPPPPETPGPTTSNNSFYNTAPCLPPYTAYDLQGASMFPDSSGLSDDSQSGASHMWPNMIPPRYSPPYYPPDEKPPPYSP
ncbi:Transmembrane protein 255A [Labeo rohita]|uniref:Transmembrane protein 255A n=1 Tax=Labeo rohita TaxID=84645 RepID=A0ABQ8M1U4_LABRO|nr:Transmembrane protein 255A [Labeo rohita]